MSHVNAAVRAITTTTMIAAGHQTSWDRVGSVDRATELWRPASEDMHGNFAPVSRPQHWAGAIPLRLTRAKRPRRLGHRFAMSWPLTRIPMRIVSRLTLAALIGVSAASLAAPGTSHAQRADSASR